MSLSMQGDRPPPDIAAESLVGRLRRFVRLPTASGGVVMAAGIFGVAALQHIPLADPALPRLFALAVLAIWAAIAACFLVSLFDGSFAAFSRDPVGGFALGTWVAATAVLDKLILLDLPDWHAAAVAFAVLAVVLWLWFQRHVVRGFRAMLASAARRRAHGIVLLSTVSTQALAMTLPVLLPPDAARLAATALIVLGFAIYLTGAAMIVQRYIRESGWSLADDWDNTNCILHGAMSITGRASVVSGAVPLVFCQGLWGCTAAMLLAVETIEAARLVVRIRRYGWRRGAFTYHVSQWARNFTFGMFYAFTLALVDRAGSQGFFGPLQQAVADYGQFVVLAFLLVEIAIFLASRLARPAVSSRSSP